MKHISTELKVAQCYKLEAENALKSYAATKPKKGPSRLPELMLLARYMHELSLLTSSTKVYGQTLREQLPLSQELDAPTRSNLLWLFRALNVAGEPGKDILEVLEVTALEEFHSDHPTVILREYKKRKTQTCVGIEANN